MEKLGVRSKSIMVRGVMASLMAMLVLIGVVSWLSPVTPVLAQVGAPVMMGNHRPHHRPKRKRRALPRRAAP